MLAVWLCTCICNIQTLKGECMKKTILDCYARTYMYVHNITLDILWPSFRRACIFSADFIFTEHVRQNGNRRQCGNFICPVLSDSTKTFNIDSCFLSFYFFSSVYRFATLDRFQQLWLRNRIETHEDWTQTNDRDTSSSGVTGVGGSLQMADSHLLLKLSKIKSHWWIM